MPRGALALNPLRLEEADDRLGERIVVRIATAPDGRRNAGIRESIRVAHRQILRATVTVMDKPVGRVATAVVDRLFERIEDEIRVQRARHPPADDASGEDVDDKG